MTTDRASPREPGAVVLLGDSILDNGAYTGGGPHVAAQLQAALPPGWRAVLAAVDGATRHVLAPIVRLVAEHDFASKRTALFA
jgi:hypothetical protein